MTAPRRYGHREGAGPEVSSLWVGGRRVQRGLQALMKFPGQNFLFVPGEGVFMHVVFSGRDMHSLDKSWSRKDLVL